MEVSIVHNDTESSLGRQRFYFGNEHDIENRYFKYYKLTIFQLKNSYTNIKKTENIYSLGC